MRILNLFAGLGGNRTLWEDVEVVAVENNPWAAYLYRHRFPEDELIQADVYEVLRSKKFLLDFDLIWASPPCQTHSQMQKFNPNPVKRIPIPRLQEIYGLMIWLDQHYAGEYVIENVQPYYKEVVPPTARIDRHVFWATFPIQNKTFREEKWTHGKIGGNMRTSVNELITENQLEDIRDLLLNYSKDIIMPWIRNCVDPRIGKYILEELKRSKTTLLSFIGGHG